MKLAAAVVGVVNLLVLASVAVAGGRFTLFAMAVLLNIAACLAIIRSLRSMIVRVGAPLVGLLDVVMVVEEIVTMSTVKYPNAAAATVWSIYGLVNAGICARLFMSTIHHQPSKV